MRKILGTVLGWLTLGQKVHLVLLFFLAWILTRWMPADLATYFVAVWFCVWEWTIKP